MIDINVVEDHLAETGNNPYKNVPVDAQSNPVDYYGDPYDDMITHLQIMEGYLSRMANSAEAARVRPKLGMYPWVSTGTGTSTVQNTTVRFRVQELVITASAACSVSVVVGSSAQMTFQFAVADTKRFTYPVIFDRGVDVTLTSTAGNVSGYFTAYPDE